MWIRAKEDKWKESKVFKIVGAYTHDTFLYGLVADGTRDAVLGEYVPKEGAKKAFERIMMAITNNGSLVDLNKEF